MGKFKINCQKIVNKSRDLNSGNSLNEFSGKFSEILRKFLETLEKNFGHSDKISKNILS